jgi:hypothetical protein
MLVGLLPWNQLPLQAIPTIESFTAGMEARAGYFRYYWDDSAGKIWVEIERWEREFLYVEALAAGVGSNDLGLDRGQLGREKVVYFTHVGPRVLLVQPNLDYRAQSDNQDEVQSVREAFAQSVLMGAEVQAQTGERRLIDLTPFLLRDAHGVSGTLSQGGEGSYQLDLDRSAVYLPRTLNFPQNSEFEVMLTFAGQPTGRQLRTVVPTATAVSVRQHHSFIQLPDADYQPRAFDPRAGYYPFSFQDYATPIDQPLTQRFITRHRLVKKNPAAKRSEVITPIIYYVDRGAPEPIRSALMEGASWWNQAFEAAGYVDAFQVKVLPEGVDPLDVRYHVIQWVHRSTRGWSYGGGITDPRTGEIIKGHVSLGSLRVRQDFLIAQGVIEAYADGTQPDPRLEQMALARLRQLSAHEVGHTLGLAHNYLASSRDRASVMDYPYPYLTLDAEGAVDISQAYAVGIGAWDQRAILYGYQDFPATVDEAKALQAILAENETLNQAFLSDAEARPAGSAHPQAHLWDHGQDAVAELQRLTALRAHALAHLSEKNIPVGAPLATLEDVLVPVYFMHRYQVEAAAKVIGGRSYRYHMRGDRQPAAAAVPTAQQQAALEALLETLTPDFLAIPSALAQQIPPRPIGYPRGREHFQIRTGFTLDPLSAAEAAAHMTLSFLLHPQRANRLIEAEVLGQPGLRLDAMLAQVEARLQTRDAAPSLMETVMVAYVQQLMALGAAEEALPQVRRVVIARLNGLAVALTESQDNLYLGREIRHFLEDPTEYQPAPAPGLPDGSPIGTEARACGWD